ncbi:MAG: glycosyltransferase [Lentisphaerae bacterium]|nr:glycosyltransferase [Lentisphaerota bacterium]
MKLLLLILFPIYMIPTLGLMIYGLNCYVMLILFGRRYREAQQARTDMLERHAATPPAKGAPVVTTQIAVYNEYNVVERIMRAVAAMEWPQGLHEIQVLDDSSDETCGVVDRVAIELNAQGHDIKVLRRDSRLGYKAGALAEGLRQARGEFIAVFDADFVPPSDFLLSTVPFFGEDSSLGLIQTRWGHLNRCSSLLTRAQSVGIDGHFIIEQVARCWNGLFMNFNGTAGIWRRKAIEASGGWSWDTLTEDLDLSYRMQFAGWKTQYLPDVVVPAELPENINALRGQQFRWAKGSVQTLIKLFPQLMRSRAPRFKKVQAVIHMGGYLVHPMMLMLSLLALPVLTIKEDLNLSPYLYATLALPLCLSILAPSTLYFVSQRAVYSDWKRRIALLPFLIVIGVGLAVSNTKAIAEAVIGHETPFIRTPKRGERETKRYITSWPWLALVEITLGAFCCYTFSVYVAAGQYLTSPFLAIYAAGFLFVGILTLCHTLNLTGYATVAPALEPIADLA